jgi:phytoene dehydrogenase-like protein
MTLLLPHAPDDEDDAVRALGRAFADAGAGRVPIAPPLECTFPTATDPDLRDGDGRHSASVAIPWAPYDLAGTTWAAEEERLTAALVDALERFAPGTRELVVEAALHHPKKLETHFGITRGNLAHVDDTVVFGDRLSPATPISGLYMCGRSTGPAAAVLGVAGVNAARRVLADLELALEQTDVGYLDR